ncbi:hypothetical protein [Dyadobacter sp. SG02]|uniref:hypothetical protein n=1 Tax=Dyadobacter sp. SG02 TaxID=1855291 RepID=UPI000B863B93|nr:hypothetical protein [Dyadobacter sp. SG02]
MKVYEVESKGGYIFRAGFTFDANGAARSKEATVNQHDIRDLGIVAEAVCSALRKVYKSDQEFDTVNIGAIASGKG